MNIKTLPVQRLKVRYVHPPHHTPNLVPWAMLYGGYTAMPPITSKAFMVPKYQFIVLKKSEVKYVVNMGEKVDAAPAYQAVP